MVDFTFSDEGCAWAMATYLDTRYQMYSFMACRDKGHRLWRIRTMCRSTGVFLQYAKR